VAAFKNMTTAADSVYVSTGWNPIITALANVASGTNTTNTSDTITFRDAGTYYVRCWEGAETADDSAAKTSPYKIYTVSNSCTYSGTGNWALNCADNCNFTSTTTIPSTNNVTISGTGTLNFASGGKWIFSGSNQFVKIFTGCALNIYSGGGWN
jgi:hypothetical protein